MPNEPRSSSSKAENFRWTEIIEKLEHWSSEDPEWDDDVVQSFIHQVQSIAERKCKERENAGLYQLDQAITHLKENYSSDFRIFDVELSTLGNWTSENCIIESVTKQIELVHSLIVKLEMRIKLKSIEPQDFHERIRVRKDLSDLEVTIFELIKEIGQTFAVRERQESPVQGDTTETDDSRTLNPEAEVETNVELPQDPAADQKSDTEVSGSTSESDDDPVTVKDKTKPEDTVEPEDPSDIADIEKPNRITASTGTPREMVEEVPETTDSERDSHESTETSDSHPHEDHDLNSPSTKEKVQSERVTTREKQKTRPVELDQDPSTRKTKQKPRSAKSAPKLQKAAVKSDHSDTATDDAGVRPTHKSASLSWSPFGWELLGSDDWAGAYWLARSLEANGLDTPVPHQLLAVLQGSRWLEFDKDLFVSDILQIASEWSPQEKHPQRLLGLATALRPCLIAPHTGLVGWLPRRETINPGFGTLCDVIREFADRNYPLRTSDLQGIMGRATRGQAIEDLSSEARKFLADNLEHRLMFQRATKVLRYFVRPSGDLHNLLDSVIRNQPEQIEHVRQLVIGLSERKQIVDRINQIDRDKPNVKPIIGPSRNQLVRIVEEAVGLARRWCDLNELEFGLRQRGDWWDEHVSRLLVGVQDILPTVRNEINAMVVSTESREDVALGHVLDSAIGQVASMLGIESDKTEEDPSAWMCDNCSSLSESLTRRLLFVPEIKIDEEGKPPSDREADIGGLLHQSITDERSFIQVIEVWIEQQDFRFSEVLLNGLDDELLSQEYRIKCNECLKKSRLDLQKEIAVVRDSIERGIVDGLLNEEERTSFSAELEQVTAEDSLHFRPLFQRLKEINEKLNQKLEDRMQDLNIQWNKYKEQLAESSDPDLQLNPVTAFFQNAIENRDTRVMEEGLARIGEYFQGTTEWKKEWFERPTHRDVLVEFIEASSPIDSGLSELSNFDILTTDFVARGQTWCGLKFGQLPPTRREDACLGLRSWHQLKRRKGNRADYRRHIKALMEFLGFHISNHESAVKIKSYDKDWIYCQVAASSSDLARPIPQMGSHANGRYDVLCMWDRPGASSIRATLNELKLDKSTLLLFYLGRLSEKQRHNLSNMNMNHNLTIATLDEILLVFLAGSDDNRLPDFLRCSLPYSAFNPYMPFQAGNVPPEMFYGREDKIRQLMQNEGSCMVYGGRQLGKSALLRKVEREFHLPEREQYAWVEDIKLLGEVTSGEHPSRLWIRLRDGFKNQSLLGSKITTNQPEVVIKHIRQTMNQSTQLRVMVLFDEADNFLGADAQNSFQVVEGLRSLMQDTQLRFKVVFAGLHDVQRFYNISNQPLAHFGLNLRMGPLEPGPAQQLVREPLEALGFRFVDDTTVLKVLSYTNYHPGLIQYFCYELVGRLQDKTHNTGPPYEVCSEDVESVYRSTQVRKVIRERLDWTLALDPRYQCIAWTMICEQKQMQESSVTEFTVNELLDLVRYWWNEGFKEVDSGELRILLEEMVGLGILARKLENEFQLRSPNLVRLMGSEEVIEGRLLDLGEKPYPPQFQPTRNHSPIDREKRVYSPLTLSQEGQLKERHESGVMLIFGSRALGIARLDAVFSGMENGAPIPSKNLTRRDLPNKWMTAFSRTKKAHDHLITYGKLAGTGDDMARCVWSAYEKCREFKDKESRPMRVVFILDPNATWSWLKSSKLESNVETIYLQRWDEVGIQQRLKQADKLDSMDVCSQVRQGTGGWPILLDELFYRCVDLDDPRTCIEAVVSDLDTSESTLRNTFLQEVGLDRHTVPTRVFKTIAAYGEIRGQDLESLTELVEGSPSLTPDDCKIAVEYLCRMGCIDKINEEYKVDSVLARLVDYL